MNDRKGQAMVRPLDIDDLHSLALPREPAISPDGERVAYTLRTTDAAADTDRRSIWLASWEGGPAVQVTNGPADGSPAWSPDGGTLAFLRAGDGHAQIWTLPMAGGEPRQATHLPLGAGRPIWSPDGALIAFTAPVDRAGGDPERRAVAPVVVERLGHKADGVGLRRAVRRHLHVLDLAGGQVRRLTDGDWDAGEPSWSPDGTRLAFAAAPEPDADLTLASAAYVVDVAGVDVARVDVAGSPPRRVGPAGGFVDAVTWTPDGDALVVVGTPAVRIGHLGLFLTPLDGGAPVPVAASLDRNIRPGQGGWYGAFPQFTPDGRTLLFGVNDRGSTHVYSVEVEATEVEDGSPKPFLATPGWVVSGLSVAARADRAAAVVMTPQSYGEIAAVDLAGGEPRLITRHTATSLPGVAFTAPQEREFTTEDGRTVHGWLLRDPAAAAPGPLLVDVHGGPHLAWGPALEPANPYHQILAGRGWSVLLLNPRASDGYGEDFYTANLHSWGHGDERDLLDPVDQLVAEGVADPARLAICGYSYGGFMTGHLTTRTDRFAAAVVAGMMADLVSAAGTSDQNQVFATLEFGAHPHEDRALVRSQSPVEHVEHVTTPTLVLHAVHDERCPVGQAEAWFTALRVRGVRARMVLYPDASHQFIVDGRPSHRADYNGRIIDWVSEHTSRER
ncbi:S9 family peptidase [Nonomuraea sp. NPDC059194]|uniref:S9 family peptidase n=1 Tax=Nonomuraea sp. NPDC059194 TaxID=3346764 RepID=UPI00369E54F7